MEKQEMALPPLSRLQRVLHGGRRTFVGLDIGSHTIKLAKLERSHPRWKMTVASEELPPDAIVEGRIMNLPAVVDAISQLVQETDSYGEECGVAVSGTALILKKLVLPEMTMAELDESLMWEAETYIPWDIKDVNVAASILDPKAGQGTMDVLMLAAKKEVVNEYFSIALEAGLKPVLVDAGIITLLNLLKTNYLEAVADKTVLVVDVGANSTNIGVLSNGKVAFSRDIALGSSHYTAELQTAFNIPWETAEVWKQLEEDDDEVAEVQDFITAKKQVGEIADRFVAQLITEIQRSTDFFIATSIKAEFSRLYLTGGGAANHRLINELERRMEIPVEVLNPFKNLPPLPGDELTGNSWALAIGLALRGLDDETPNLVRINLIGQKYISAKPSKTRNLLSSVINFLILLWRATFVPRQKKLRVTKTEMQKLAFALSYTMGSGLPVLDILSETARWLQEPLRSAIFLVRNRVSEGKCLAESLEKAGFPPLFCLMVSAGEIRGGLDTTFKDYMKVVDEHPEFGL